MGFNNLYNQVANQIKGQTTENPSDLNPRFISTKVESFKNVNNLPASVGAGTFPWAVIYAVGFALPPKPLDNNTFKSLGMPLATFIYNSPNGNLAIDNLKPKTVYSFSASIYRNLGGSTTVIHLPWSSYVTVIMNNVILHQAVANKLPSLSLSFQKGKNDLVIYIGTF